MVVEGALIRFEGFWGGLGDLGLAGNCGLEACWNTCGRCSKLFGVVWGVLAWPGAGFYMSV